MKILAIEHELKGVAKAEFRKYANAEALRAWELMQENIIREIYFRDDANEAVLILECESVKEAQQHLDTLPLVKYGLIRFELIPLKPYPGFERLMK